MGIVSFDLCIPGREKKYVFERTGRLLALVSPAFVYTASFFATSRYDCNTRLLVKFKSRLRANTK